MEQKDDEDWENISMSFKIKVKIFQVTMMILISSDKTHVISLFIKKFLQISFLSYRIKDKDINNENNVNDIHWSFFFPFSYLKDLSLTRKRNVKYARYDNHIIIQTVYIYIFFNKWYKIG